MRAWWSFGVAVPLTWLLACSSASQGFPSESTSVADDSDGGSDGAVFFSPTFDDASLSLGDSTVAAGNSGPCQGGKYKGTFAGLYTSHLTGVGIPIPVTGNAVSYTHLVARTRDPPPRRLARDARDIARLPRAYVEKGRPRLRARVGRRPDGSPAARGEGRRRDVAPFRLPRR